MSRSDSRARFRADITREALAQLTRGGPEAVSVNAIGRALGVSGPAIYRYFSGRPELLTALALDAYADLDSHLARHDSSLSAITAAYREWALGNPHRYGLLFGSPAPGYDNQADELIAAAHAVMDRLLRTLGPDAGREPSTATLQTEVARWLRARGTDIATPARGLRALEVWVQVHGLVSIELGGSLAAMGIDGGRLLRELVAPTVPAPVS